MSGTLKHILMLVVVVAAVAAGYYLIQNSSLLTGATMRASEVEATTAELEKEALADLAKLQRMSLEAAMFDTPEYAALVDHAVAVRPAPLSRTNPFAER